MIQKRAQGRLTLERGMKGHIKAAQILAVGVGIGIATIAATAGVATGILLAPIKCNDCRYYSGCFTKKI